MSSSLDQIIVLFYGTEPYSGTELKNSELEVRFVTRSTIKNEYNKQGPYTKNEYDNVIKRLKSCGFTTINDTGEYSLRIQSEYTDRKTSQIRQSPVRVEIYGLLQVQKYCRTGDLAKMVKDTPNAVKFVRKRSAYMSDLVVSSNTSSSIKKTINNEKTDQRIQNVIMDDYRFQVSFQIEESITHNFKQKLLEDWTKNKKSFRYLNRVQFIHPDFPIKADLSIVRANYIKTYSTDEAGIFKGLPTNYEIELEIDNKAIGPGTQFNNPVAIANAMRRVIKYVLCGIQETEYPIGLVEQQTIMSEYLSIIKPNVVEKKKFITTKDFIGPSSVTLQTHNITPIDPNSEIPNIRQDFVVTDKADGERHLMLISGTGRIYFITTNMHIIFSGTITKNKTLFMTLLDGEYIMYNKNRLPIHLFAAFDIYFLQGRDVRTLPFISMTTASTFLSKDTKDIKKRAALTEFRYILLQQVMRDISIKNVIDITITPSIRLITKQFIGTNIDIFQSCKDILIKQYENQFEYSMDGLIFTHALFGVGSNKIGIAGALSKRTWEWSFKWKPPKYNTIDFLTTTVKDPKNGNIDLIRNRFEDGINLLSQDSIIQYKTVQLRCTFIEKIHGFINPYQDVLDDKIMSSNGGVEEEDMNRAQPVQFYPTDPYDQDAGIANIPLHLDDRGVLQMITEENNIFNDNTIVEYSYDPTAEAGWRWQPLRVRYDKTIDMQNGGRNFGNAYHVANNNWQSIHRPITEEMISTGNNISDTPLDADVYYLQSGKSAKTYTQAMRNFHNMFVKTLLISAVSHPEDILIDFACGKAGDLPKWIRAQIAFVLGIDISKDNIENR